MKRILVGILAILCMTTQVCAESGEIEKANIGSGSGGLEKAYKTADTTRTNTTTLTADPELFIAVDASSTYAFQMFIWFEAHTTPDWKYQLGVPSGGSCDYFYDSDALASATVLDESSVTNGSGIGIGTPQFIDLNGVLFTDSAGNFTFDWAQNTSSASQTKVKKGSYMLLWKLN